MLAERLCSCNDLVYACAHMHPQACPDTCICMHASKDACMHTCTHAHVHANMHRSIHADNTQQLDSVYPHIRGICHCTCYCLGICWCCLHSCTHSAILQCVHSCNQSSQHLLAWADRVMLGQQLPPRYYHVGFVHWYFLSWYIYLQAAKCDSII